MVDAHYIDRLLNILKTHNVKTFKTNGLELEFHVEQAQDLRQQPSSLHAHSEHQGPTESVEKIAEVIKKQEESLPPDLRADNLMNQDNILNWSSPDQPQEQPAMPLTGEQPL